MVRLLGAPRLSILTALLGAGMIFSTAPAQADTPLHAFCYSTSICADNNTVTPVNQSQPNFGFWLSSGPGTGDYRIDILVPNNDLTQAQASALTYSLTGTQGGSSNNQAINATATLFSTTAWTSGDLTTYLSRDAKPPNPLSAWLPSTQQPQNDPGATGYYVFDANLGTTTLQAESADLSGPLLMISPGLQLGSLVVGFLSSGIDKKTGNLTWLSTAQSAALFYGTSMPEPGTLFLVFGGLLGLGMLRRRVRTQTI